LATLTSEDICKIENESIVQFLSVTSAFILDQLVEEVMVEDDTLLGKTSQCIVQLLYCIGALIADTKAAARCLHGKIHNGSLGSSRLSEEIQERDCDSAA